MRPEGLEPPRVAPQDPKSSSARESREVTFSQEHKTQHLAEMTMSDFSLSVSPVSTVLTQRAQSAGSSSAMNLLGAEHRGRVNPCGAVRRHERRNSDDRRQHREH